MNREKATYDRNRNRWKKRLPSGSTSPAKWAYGKTEELCLMDWREKMGLNAVRLRPGSVAQFVVAAGFWEWLGARVSALSLERYKTVWNKQLGPQFGTVRFDEITPALAQSRLMLFRGGLGHAVFPLLIESAAGTGMDLKRSLIGSSRPGAARAGTEPARGQCPRR